MERGPDRSKVAVWLISHVALGGNTELNQHKDIFTEDMRTLSEVDSGLFFSFLKLLFFWTLIVKKANFLLFLAVPSCLSLCSKNTPVCCEHHVGRSLHIKPEVCLVLTSFCHSGVRGRGQYLKEHYNIFYKV